MMTVDDYEGEGIEQLPACPECGTHDWAEKLDYAAVRWIAYHNEPDGHPTQRGWEDTERPHAVEGPLYAEEGMSREMTCANGHPATPDISDRIHALTEYETLRDANEWGNAEAYS